MAADEKKAFSRRLNDVCDTKGVPPKGQARQIVVAKIFNVSQKGARKWLEGEGFPSTDKAIEIARWADVSYEWLMTGRGSRSAQPPANPKLDLALKLMERMSEYKRDEAIKILTVLAEHNGDSRNGTEG